MKKIKKQIRVFAYLLITFTWILPGYTEAQIFKTGPQVATFYSEIDDSEQPYGLYIPQKYNPAMKYPLVIMLHGATSNHRLALRRVFGKPNLPGQPDAEASRFFPEWKDIDYIVATPYARGTMGYVGVPEEDVMRVLEECKSNFSIDENRVYLTGLSMGGGGTLYIGLIRPDLFAAIAPVCPAPPDEALELTGNALNLPVAIFQGGDDQVVKPEEVRKIRDQLLEAGASVEFREFPGVRHNVWVQAYDQENIFHWFDGHIRNEYPERVRYSTKWYKYNSAYWVLIDKMTPGTMAHIDAAFAGTNNLEVKTGHLEAFTLRLNGHPSFSKNEPLTIRINGLPVRSAPKLNHSFLLKDGKWVAEKAETAVTSKKPGLEGPMARAFTRRIVIVYGTANASGDQEISERRALAVKAADFSVSFGSGFSQPSQINPRVLSDKQVTADDYMFSNFLIFGTKETNEVIAKLADNLPLHLDADAKDYGLVYGYPVNGNLVVIASGIPFWTYKGFSPDQTTGGPRTRIRFATGDGAKALSELKDYLFFDGKNKQVIADGFFDQEWKLGEDDLRKFRDTGVVDMNYPR